MQTEFSAAIVFKDSEQNAYKLRVFVTLGGRTGCIDVAVWCDIEWKELCTMLSELEAQAKKRYRIRKPVNRGLLHLVN